MDELIKANGQANAQADIALECDALKALLLKKNQDYGNSALDPVRVFSKASPEEQLLVRIDDKLSRLKRGADAGEDVVLDLLGYLILLRVQRRRNEVQKMMVQGPATNPFGPGPLVPPDTLFRATGFSAGGGATSVCIGSNGGSGASGGAGG
jgi:hypothetical protein